MEVRFQTKEESKKQQQEEFLKLSGEERFMQFLKLSRKINKLFPPKDKLSFEERNKGNFLLIHKDLQEDDEMG
ncbi:hypothetical protein [Psychroflexus planctonicus]|uniref:Uncharacterized protein n=1 Tax=Psychroflexus planctonicus TaxID=1526575 RepID=A0ABQ1SIB2_9FLAO|nr:hypothetical protein [Psychroflexus planctonicus]GGE38399.1 hypothetical protein GCM10010832_18330 [Psychroflexus planctonicus]